MSTQPFLIFSLLAVTAWSAICPRDSFTWWLEAFPVLLGLPLIIWAWRRFPLTPLACWLLWAHAIILLIGAHYTYAEVPAFNWLRDHFDLARNHYDRLGHFAQGFVPAIVLRELLLRSSPLKSGKWLFTLVLFSCLGISALYELIEWLAAALTGEAADAFLGTQGDSWDTQKDMLLAMIGAAGSQFLLSKFHNAQIKKVS